MKVCTKCRSEKPLEDFYNRKNARDGKTSWCKFCHKVRKKQYYDKNSAEINRKHYEWYKSLPAERKEPYKKSAALRSATTYRSKRNAQEAKRRFQKHKATPNWLSEKHLQQIEDVYWLCKDLKSVSGEDYHVDHIIPLKNKSVCGLHVPWNLQVLPSDINISKSNSHLERKIK